MIFLFLWGAFWIRSSVLHLSLVRLSYDKLTGCHELTCSGQENQRYAKRFDQTTALPGGEWFPQVPVKKKNTAKMRLCLPAPPPQTGALSFRDCPYTFKIPER